MSGILKLEGSITAGPPLVTDPSPFPSEVSVIQLVATPQPKAYTRRLRDDITIASADGEVTLAIGSIEATFLYLRSDNAVTVKVTFGAAAQSLSLHGTIVMEAPAADPITAITAQVASGTATIEYLVSG